MWFSRKKHKRAVISRGRRLCFDQLEERALLSISYPIDPSAIIVDGGALTANFIPVDSLTIDSDATVDLTALSGNPTENMSIKNTTNNGELNVTGGIKTIGSVSGIGDLTISGGATLTVTSISCNTLTVGAGSKLVIAPHSGGPLPGGVKPAPEDCSAVMDGGTLTYNSDALPNLSTVNSPTLVCTDPPDTKNAWRSTETLAGGDILNFPYEPDSAVQTRIMGPTTIYRNRFEQPIVLEQTYQDIAWDETVSDHYAPLAIYYNNNSIYYGSDSVNVVSANSDALTAFLSGQGSTFEMTDEERWVTKNGAEQLHVIQDGYFTTYEAGGISYTYDDEFFKGHWLSAGVYESKDAGTAEVEEVVPSQEPGPGPWPSFPSFEVAHGTSWLDSILALGEIPSGDFTQPASAGGGTISENTDPLNRSITVEIALFGRNPRHSSCNTLMYSDISIDAGTIKGYANGPPGRTMSVSYEAKVVISMTADDPQNPTHGSARGRVHCSVVDADGGQYSEAIEIDTENGVPIPNGRIIIKRIEAAGSVHVTFDASGKGQVFTITPTMANHGGGSVYYSATASIHWLGWFADGPYINEAVTESIEQTPIQFIPASFFTPTAPIIAETESKITPVVIDHITPPRIYTHVGESVFIQTVDLNFELWPEIDCQETSQDEKEMDLYNLDSGFPQVGTILIVETLFTKEIEI